MSFTKKYKEFSIGAIIVALIGIVGIHNKIEGDRKIENEKAAAAQLLAAQTDNAAREIEDKKEKAAQLLLEKTTDAGTRKDLRENYSRAIGNINSRDIHSRNSAIRHIENNWTNIIAESPKKQWLTVKALASSITTYPLVNGKSAIKEKKNGIQMALNILKSRNPEDDNKGKTTKEGSRIIGLVKTNLRDYDLSNGQFPNAAFNKSILDNATLTGANLKGSYLSGSSLKGANLKNVDLSKAEVRGTDLSGSDLSGANLADSDLMKTDFHRANLKNVNLTGSNITEQQILQSCNWRLTEDNNGKIEDLKQRHVYRKKSGCEKIE
jgi:Pentapeptide repeats (8 copies)